MVIRQLILCIYYLVTQIYQTRKSGLGVRTTRAFFKGEIIAQYPGDLISTVHELNQREVIYDNNTTTDSYIFMFKWKGKTYWYVCHR